MRLWMLAFVAGCAWVQSWSVLPSSDWRVVVATTGAMLLMVGGMARLAGRPALAMGLRCCRQVRGDAGRRLAHLLPASGRVLLGGCLLASGLALGCAWSVLMAQSRLDDGLAPANVNEVSRVLLRVSGLPEVLDRGWRFEADVLQARPDGVPRRMLVTWLAPGGPGTAVVDALPPEPVPGQLWRAALVLRPPAGTRNPSLFDYEGWMFSRGLRAQATVRGVPERLADDAAGPHPWQIEVQVLRHALRARMLADLGDARYGAVLVALALGDQAGVAAEDWRVFNGLGITHLVSISGAHVTLIASVLAWMASAGWRRLSWRGRGLAERWPAQQIGAVVALVTAGAYCLLAGWGVPARRTFFMLAVALLAMLLRLPLSFTHVLALAAGVVAVLDPWAVLSAGFWLSFAAVTVLAFCVAPARPLRSGVGVRGLLSRVWMVLCQATRVQWAITLALMPVLALIFQQLPLLSPLANALAIPVVGSLVTPLTLLAACLYAMPWLHMVAHWVLWLAHGLFEAMMWPLGWLVDSAWGLVDVAVPPTGWLLVAGLGVWWALRPAGWPLRWTGWLLMLPCLCWTPPRLPHGAWRIHAIDVGQGSAILVETASGITLFDTGMRHGPTSDAGSRIVWPYLRSQGWRRVDELVVSHADLDHAGGLASLLRATRVGVLYASFDVEAFLRREARLQGQPGLAPDRLPPLRQYCHQGRTWERDGVHFAFLLHPPPESEPPWRRGGNADSCVLQVNGLHHTALLTGDIGTAQERRLVAEGLTAADWVAAAHHGSATSSSMELVRATGARHVVAQMGAWNRYRHPHPAVELRWRAAGAMFWRSDWHGAVLATSDATGLVVTAERDLHRRYWQTVVPGMP